MSGNVKQIINNSTAIAGVEQPSSTGSSFLIAQATSAAGSSGNSAVDDSAAHVVGQISHADMACLTVLNQLLGDTKGSLTTPNSALTGSGTLADVDVIANAATLRSLLLQQPRMNTTVSIVNPLPSLLAELL